MNGERTLTLPFHITERDVALLSAIARFRFLSSGQLHGIVGGSERGVRNRLRLLTQSKYLVRIAPVITEPFAYGLGNAGARLLAQLGHGIDDRLDWASKNARTDYFRAHTLEIAEVMLRLQSAVDDGVVLVDHQALLDELPAATRDTSHPFQLRVSIPSHDTGLTVPVIPDRLFALRYADGTAHNFALELDRGTMDIWANRLIGKSSMRRKLLAYHHARENDLFSSKWGFRSFRVLTVTTSEQRVMGMLKAQQRAVAHCPSGFFLYSTLERLAQHGAMGPAWISSRCDAVSLRHVPRAC